MSKKEKIDARPAQDRLSLKGLSEVLEVSESVLRNTLSKLRKREREAGRLFTRQDCMDGLTPCPLPEIERSGLGKGRLVFSKALAMQWKKSRDKRVSMR